MRAPRSGPVWLPGVAMAIGSAARPSSRAARSGGHRGRARRRAQRLERDRDALRRFALTDALTGIANRRSLLARIEYEIARYSRAQHSFAVLMLDLDGFKRLNDRFGHAAGDDLLRDVADAIKGSLRGQDTLARLGGDEFCVLAPETDRAGTGQLAARIARAVGEVTAGVATLRASSGVAPFPRRWALGRVAAAGRRSETARRQARPASRRSHPPRRVSRMVGDVY